MLGFYNYTVVLTYLSLISAMIGIFQAFNNNIFGAIVCLMFSGFCDMFDGKVARTKKRTEEEKKFGIQIDSLCDLIAFGVLPAVIGYNVGLDEWWGQIICVSFALAALIRLAYFNVLEEARQKKTTENRKDYLGLPVTSTALIMPLVYAVRLKLGVEWEYFYIVYGCSLLLVGFLFLYKFKVKKPSLKGMVAMMIFGALELVLLMYLFGVFK